MSHLLPTDLHYQITFKKLISWWRGGRGCLIRRCFMLEHPTGTSLTNEVEIV